MTTIQSHATPMASSSVPSTPGPGGARQVSKSRFKAHALEGLRGSVLRFEDPFEPVAAGEWEALG